MSCHRRVYYVVSGINQSHVGLRQTWFVQRASVKPMICDSVHPIPVAIDPAAPHIAITLSRMLHRRWWLLLGDSWRMSRTTESFATHSAITKVIWLASVAYNKVKRCLHQGLSKARSWWGKSTFPTPLIAVILSLEKFFPRPLDREMKTAMTWPNPIICKSSVNKTVAWLLEIDLPWLLHKIYHQHQESCVLCSIARPAKEKSS